MSEPFRQEGEPRRAGLSAKDLFLLSERAHLMVMMEGKVPVLWINMKAGKESCQMFRPVFQ